MTSALACLTASCHDGAGLGKEDATFSDAEWDIVESLSPVPAVPDDSTNAVADLAAAATLGQKFFFDARFSGPLVRADNVNSAEGGNGDVGDIERISCSRCHDPSAAFTDTMSIPGTTSLGAGRTGRNAPTVFNTAFNDWLFHDGRTDSLWSQAIGPVESPVEHNFNRVAVVQIIFDLYRAEYEAVFGPLPDFRDAGRFPQVPNPPAFEGQGRPGDGPGGLGLDSYDEMTSADQVLVDTAFANFGKSIAAYERQIVTRNSAFDRYVAGSQNAISAAAKRGLTLFIGRGFCINCHSGPNFTDNEFHNVGVAQSGDFVPLTDQGRLAGAAQVLQNAFNGAGDFSDDPIAGGRKLAGVSQDSSQLGRFKTPSLRDVSRTRPYFHTGTVDTLRDVVQLYNRGGDGSGFLGETDPEIVPLGLDENEVVDLVEFLETLDGEILPPALTSAPSLP